MRFDSDLTQISGPKNGGGSLWLKSLPIQELMLVIWNWIICSYPAPCIRFLPRWTNIWRRATARPKTCLLSMWGASRYFLNIKHENFQENVMCWRVSSNYFPFSASNPPKSGTVTLWYSRQTDCRQGRRFEELNLLTITFYQHFNIKNCAFIIILLIRNRAT